MLAMGAGFSHVLRTRRPGKRRPPAARWAGRIVLGLIVLLILGAINQAKVIGLTNWIPHPLIGKIWLPLFGLCLYILHLAGLVALSHPQPGSRVRALRVPGHRSGLGPGHGGLARAEIRLDSTPLFLVLGWSSGSEEAFFQAAGIKAKVNQVPRDRGEPLHVTADRDSIWLTCPGASLLDQQNPAIVGQDDGSEHLGTMVEQSSDPFKTIGIGQGEGMGLQDLLSRREEGAGRERVPARQAGHRSREVLRPLRHLCRLIKRDRLGFCPINGVLVLLPVSTADPKSGPEEIAAACRSDLTEAFGVMRLRCPVLVMVTDLERLEVSRNWLPGYPQGRPENGWGSDSP